MRKAFVILLCVLLGLSVALNYYQYEIRIERKKDILPDTIIVYDTIPSIAPKETEIKELPTITARLPVAPSSKKASNSIDSCLTLPDINHIDVDEDSDHPPNSIDVLVPITQKVYEDSTYRAYVSGYNASLDSIYVFRRTEYITNNIPVKTKPKRFSIGVQAGYGITPKGFQPYIGIGISVYLFSI